VRLEARLADGTALETFFVNGLGLGALVPPGEHAIELLLSYRDLERVP
jgi:hypothetical protein